MTSNASLLYMAQAKQGMFDYRDPDFTRTTAQPVLGAPVCKSDAVVFVCEDRFVFDEYNVEFTNTHVESTLAPPVMTAGRAIRCTRA